MSGTRSWLKRATDALKSYGCTVDEITTNKHIKIKFTRADGQQRQMTMSVSPSDGNAETQMLRTVRRLCESPEETKR